ncbi:dihydrofolate reductase family protein [Micromonospora parathelypteridis]|uniref:Dihydrofolate reductase n=1 Tax=Micromonospora parathelypteridis TaxID=1839617 RepID=A0A840VXH7_9ACTN|nr:dihydrofolate reductase family protein [Micromonospora parathelypteridis]MBB5475741.1 dihydrofolate reductase [Micromonospora parathelypteridis]GGO26777.1 deaminase reductase [Micromonospora parathelypteridis]
MTSKLVVGTFLSLDGVMQGPAGPGEDDSSDFPHGGWLPPHLDEGFGEIMGGVFERADGMLLGRRSYDILSSHWPNVSDEDGGAKINNMPKYVATRTPMTADWRNTEVLVGDAAETVAALKQRTDGELLVQGSSDLLRTLQTAGLVDEYQLLIFPVVLGQGKRLFAEGTAAAGLRLTGSRTTKAGVVYAAYEVAGPPSYGTIMQEAS